MMRSDLVRIELSMMNQVLNPNNIEEIDENIILFEDFEQWQRFTEQVSSMLLKYTQQPLNAAEIFVLKGIWSCKTYREIANIAGYSAGYFAKVVAPQLFSRLSIVLGQRVTKKNCKILLQEFVEYSPSNNVARQRGYYSTKESVEPQTTNFDDLPSEPSAIPSKQEQQNQRWDSKGTRDIDDYLSQNSPSSSSLSDSFLSYAFQAGLFTVTLSFEQADQDIIQNLDRCLRWLALCVTQQLQLKPQLDQYWNPDLGSKLSCTQYFNHYLLPELDSPLLLVASNIYVLFDYPDTAQGVLHLLESWDNVYYWGL